MVRWFAGFAVILLLISASAFAQGFSTSWINAPGIGTMLTTVCPANGGTTPIPDGRIVKIFWDSNSNGPDAADPQPTVCNDPPNCDLGPAGTVNYSQFTMNGTNIGLGAGYFYTDANFTSVGVLPSPPRYYLRIYDTDGTTVLWTSNVFTLGSGAQDIYLQASDWTCGNAGPQCVVRDEHE